jgi:hypothetical protein
VKDDFDFTKFEDVIEWWKYTCAKKEVGFSFVEADDENKRIKLQHRTTGKLVWMVFRKVPGVVFWLLQKKPIPVDGDEQ